MSEDDHRPEFRFGRTVVSVVTGDLLSQEAEAVVIAANRRGVMGPLATPGHGPLRSLGGSEIEREAMRLAPLDLGTAIVTKAPGLEERGIRHLIHAVVHPALGEPARIDDIRRAVPAALAAASQRRLRTVAIPLLGVESLAAPAEVEAGLTARVELVGPALAIAALGGVESLAAPAEVEAGMTALVEELVATLRRSMPRLDRVIIVCRFSEQADAVQAALARARERVWTRVP